MMLIERSAWGARPPKNPPTAAPLARGVTFHWEGTSIPIEGHTFCPARVRSIQNFHMDSREWNDIAYNFLVCQHGVVFEGRGLGVRSAANGTNITNRDFYAVCYMGGPSGVGFTDVARNAMREVRDYLAGPETWPHSQWRATDCPGNAIRAWITDGCPAVATPAPTPAPVPAPAPSDWTEEMLMALPTLQFGSSGQYVRNLQGLLNAAGRTVTIDGSFGSITRSKLTEWQAAAGIGADGICGPKTWRTLLGA